MVAALLLCASCHDVSSDGDAETLSIIGGTEADLALVKSTGALYARTDEGVRFVCSGVLIAPDLVLTAAHCIAKTMSNELLFSLKSALQAAEPEDASVISRRAVHGEFRWQAPPGEPLHDLALLQLAAPRPENTARIGADNVQRGAFVALVGYGDTALAPASAASPDAVRNVGLATVSSAADRELTVEDEVQACLGDSGGPALLLRTGLWRPRVVGITSRAVDPKQPCVAGTIYTRVDAYADWIRDTHARWQDEAAHGPGIDGGVVISAGDAAVDAADGAPLQGDSGRFGAEAAAFSVMSDAAVETADTSWSAP